MHARARRARVKISTHTFGLPMIFISLYIFPRVNFQGVFPKDLRRRTATRTKFGAHFWRRLIANIDLAQQFGAE